LQIRNTTDSYGVVAISLHWLLAAALFGQFALGIYMVDLDYYDPWYHKAPAWHVGLGVLISAFFLIRWFWRLSNPLPRLSGARWEQKAARAAHRLFYVLALLIVVSGYLISTAEGEALDVFGIFSVPATVQGLPDQADTAGAVHKWLAWTLMALVGLHSLAALKHQFIDRDGALLRIIRTHRRIE